MNRGVYISKGFTIVELLIVIVVIAILAAITIVAYNGIQERAEASAAQSALTQSAKKIETLAATSTAATYPATIQASDISLPASTTFQYSQTSGGTGYCLTTLYNNSLVYSIGTNRTITPNPCDGHSGGATYCPTDTHVAINGFYCDGAVGAVAPRNENAVKLDASAAEVPVGAPGAFVGKQTSRDNIIGAFFTVSPGQVYCIEGWAATPSSTVAHSIGLRITVSGVAQWVTVNYAPAAGLSWKKLEGCITIPAGGTQAALWSQNNGSNGTTAAAPWYQTAIRFRLQ